MTTLLVLLSLLRFQLAFAPPYFVDHDHQERYEIPRYEDTIEYPGTVPVWFNVSADVWGHYNATEPYYRENHNITYTTGCGVEPTDDFRFLPINITYYGLYLNGTIAYRNTTLSDQWWGSQDWNTTTSYEIEDVYYSYTYINCSVRDLEHQLDPEFYNFTLTAFVSRRDIAITSVTASPSEVFPGQNVSVNVYPKNFGAANETSSVTAYAYNTGLELNYTIGTLNTTLTPNSNDTLRFTWNTTGVTLDVTYTIMAKASVVPYENDTGDNTYIDGTVIVKDSSVRFMQNAKWDSTYWKLYWNNTATYNSYSLSRPYYVLSGYLGVKIYNGSDELTSGVFEVGRWFNLQSGIKSKTWELADDVNITGTYIKVAIWYKFQGESWQDMGVTFKTENFTDNTILNAANWTIYLWGSYYIQGGPLKGPLGGPGGFRSGISFGWGCSARESRIEDMIFTYG